MTNDCNRHETPAAPARGGFTMPGEAGSEDRVLELARLWGADAVRDSDGTELSEKIQEAGYPIYSTLCMIRGDNEFARAHRDKCQQIFLASRETLAESAHVSVDLLAVYPKDAYEVNASPESVACWQVFDRTTGDELARDCWSFSPATGAVEIRNARKWHRYSVNFLSFEIWESINRYNHQVNNWTTEPQMPLNPAYPEVRERMRVNLESWLDRNPHVDVVRFTTFYYGNGRGGWGDYGRTVCPRILDEFEKKYGYRLTSETFVNGGLYNPTHRPPSREYLDWMTFQHDFFVRTMHVFVDMVHARGKKAFFILDDQWIGSEPLEGRFGELGMDGVVKSVFNGSTATKLGSAARLRPCPPRKSGSIPISALLLGEWVKRG
ncbi:MAG: 1,3-beta-galactosyl-N-acetylhexosamine phosphorylase N-terminal domain-containing protein [Planctomycetota bacterium]